MRTLLRGRAVALSAVLSVALFGCSDSGRTPTNPRTLNPSSAEAVGGPDLVLTAVSLDSFTSNSVSYSWTLENAGDAPAVLEGPTGDIADNVSVQAFLSNDTVFGNAGDIPAGGTVVGSSPIADLAPGATLNGSFSSSVTEDPCGFAYLILKCDWGEVVVELDEDNNTAADQVACGPDLVLSAFSLDSFTSNSVSYSWTLENVGNAPAVLEGPTGITADNVSVQAMLSNDTVFGNAGDIPAGGTVVGSSPIADLAPGATLNGSFSSSVTEDPCGFAYLILKCDWGEVVVELDEDNNTAADAIVCQKIDIKPDSDVNPINPKNKGVIPVVICGSAAFDVSDIIPDSITFGPWGASEAHGKVHPGDYNNDGYPDLLVHFRTQETGIKFGDIEACLSASLQGGGSFYACDSIVTVPVQQVGP